MRDGPPTNPLALKCGLGLATIVLPAMIAAALDQESDLFIVTVVLLIAYFLALLIVIANSVARRFEKALPQAATATARAGRESWGRAGWGRP